MLSHHDDKTATKSEPGHVIAFATKRFAFNLDGQQNENHGTLIKRAGLNLKFESTDNTPVSDKNSRTDRLHNEEVSAGSPSAELGLTR